MTNLPNDIRQMWADAYKLHDIHAKMQNTAEDWELFWKDAREISEKYGGHPLVVQLITTLMLYMEECMK